MEMHCHITEICEPPMSSSLFSVIFFMSFQSIVIPVRYHNKFPKFVCNVIDLCVPPNKGQIIKIVWSFPLTFNQTYSVPWLGQF